MYHLSRMDSYVRINAVINTGSILKQANSTNDARGMLPVKSCVTRASNTPQIPVITARSPR